MLIYYAAVNQDTGQVTGVPQDSAGDGLHICLVPETSKEYFLRWPTVFAVKDDAGHLQGAPWCPDLSIDYLRNTIDQQAVKLDASTAMVDNLKTQLTSQTKLTNSAIMELSMYVTVPAANTGTADQAATTTTPNISTAATTPTDDTADTNTTDTTNGGAN
ncbi:hypothetical protein [Secundilactobacillus collinoides]|nr:hypothetical protein [Secundilactobacillus collinoides]KZL42597.1 hypothetical protein TY91_03835 [Secundilactobacillus collinoides]